MRRVIQEQDLIDFLSREGKRIPRREDKRNKWVFYATEEEALQIQALLRRSNLPELAVVASTFRPNKSAP